MGIMEKVNENKTKANSVVFSIFEIAKINNEVRSRFLERAGVPSL